MEKPIVIYGDDGSARKLAVPQLFRGPKDTKILGIFAEENNDPIGVVEHPQLFQVGSLKDGGRLTIHAILQPALEALERAIGEDFWVKELPLFGGYDDPDLYVLYPQEADEPLFILSLERLLAYGDIKWTRRVPRPLPEGVFFPHPDFLELVYGNREKFYRFLNFKARSFEEMAAWRVRMVPNLAPGIPLPVSIPKAA